MLTPETVSEKQGQKGKMEQRLPTTAARTIIFWINVTGLPMATQESLGNPKGPGQEPHQAPEGNYHPLGLSCMMDGMGGADKVTRSTHPLGVFAIAANCHLQVTEENPALGF